MPNRLNELTLALPGDLSNPEVQKSLSFLCCYPILLLTWKRPATTWDETSRLFWFFTSWVPL